MRFTRAQFQQLATGKGGAILEAGDGELLVPAVLQPSFELPTPFFRNAVPDAAANIEQSFTSFQFHNRAGAGALVETIHGSSLAAGVWRLSGHVTLQFTGTAAQAASMVAGLRAPDGTRVFLGAANLVGAVALSIPFDFVFHAAVAGYGFFTELPATAVGDVASIGFNWRAGRLL